MVAEIQKILNFSEAIRKWSLVTSSIPNLQEIALSLTFIKKQVNNIFHKKIVNLIVTSDLLIGNISK